MRSAACVEHPAGPKEPGQGHSLAEILHLHGKEYAKVYPLSFEQHKVFDAILGCRTSAMGARIERCDHCGQKVFLFNSCGNRHCPRCGVMAKEAWLEARRADLLPVPYFHLVFTLPHLLNPLILANKRRLLSLFFKVVSDILLEFAMKRGGIPGATLVLHTWDQKLNPHFHLHCLIPAGYLSPDSTRWVSARRDYLFPLRGLSTVLRCRLLDSIQSCHTQQPLNLPQSLHELADPARFVGFLCRLQQKDWVVHAKAPCSGPEVVLNYLARYTYRTAISNCRILDVTNGLVSFRYRDRKDNNRPKTLTLPAVEFLRRFFQHVSPERFQRIRHYGFISNRSKKESLPKCRELLNAPALPAPAPRTAQERMLALTGIDISLCPCCGQGKLHTIGRVLRPTPQNQAFSTHPIPDTS